MRTSDNIGCGFIIVGFIVIFIALFVDVLATEYSAEYWVDFYKEVPLGTTDISKVPCMISWISGPVPYFVAFGTYIHKNYIYEPPVFK